MVLVGVSRTSKTPTSIYLANRGVKTANVPLVPGVPLPPQVEKLTRPLVVGLVRQPGAHRADPREPAARPQGAPRRRPVYRQDGGGGGDRLFAPALRASTTGRSIDVTRRSIEETAAAVMRLLDRAPPRAGDARMPLWLAPQPLVLASKSDVRGKMLAAAGLRFEIRPAQIDERAVEAHAGSARCRGEPRGCWRARRRKAWRPRMPGRLVLGADQTLALRRHALQQAGRPRRGAPSNCARLRGRTPRAAFGAGAGARRQGAVRAASIPRG